MLRINKLQTILLFLTLLVLPFQLGKHFWPSFAYVAGQRVDYLSPTLYISDCFIVVLFLLTINLSFLRRQEFGFRITSGITNKKVLIFLSILLYLSLGIFLSINPLNGWYTLLKSLEFIFFSWYLANSKEEITQSLFWTFSIGILLEGALALLQFFHQGSMGGIWYFLGERSFTASTPGIANASIYGRLILRPYGTFSHPNVLAGYLVIALLFFLVYIFSPARPSKKILCMVLVLFGFIVLLLTLSRIAIVVCVLTALLFLCFTFSKYIGRIILAFCVAALALASNSLFLGRFLDTQGYIESLGLRGILMQSAWRMFVSHPLLGIGLGNFLPSLPYYLSSGILFGFLQPVHNIFLLVLAETGIVGEGIFLAILFCAFRNSSKEIRSIRHELRKKNHNSNNIMLYQFALLSLVAILLIGMTDHYSLTLQQGQLLLALVLGTSFRNFKT